MTPGEVSAIAVQLSQVIGLRFTGSAGTNAVGSFVDFGFADLDTSEGFAVRVQLGWRSLEVSFRPGSYSGQLIAEMGRASATSRAVFATLAKSCMDMGAAMALRVNDKALNCADPEEWPGKWKQLALLCRISPVDLRSSEVALGMVRDWSTRFMSLVLALLPVEDVQAPGSEDLQGFPEGARQSIEVNKYERDRRNRILCLQVKGYKCLVCEFDFYRSYGELGRDFIHVHHIIPVSQLGENYVINPIADLVPVCPNCHAMIHRRNPPYSVDELKSAITVSRSATASALGR